MIAYHLDMQFLKSLSTRFKIPHPRSGRLVATLLLVSGVSFAAAMATWVALMVEVTSYFLLNPANRRVDEYLSWLLIIATSVWIGSMLASGSVLYLQKWLQGGALRAAATGVGVFAFGHLATLGFWGFAHVRATSQDKTVI